MTKLRQALSVMLDDSGSISDRLDRAIEMVHGMGKNIATAILLVAHPEKYGVWNNRSEAALKRLDLWPEFGWGTSFGQRYVQVNQILLVLRDALETDLWTLDSLWWFLDEEAGGTTRESDISQDLSVADALTVVAHDTASLTADMVLTAGNQRFGLERHLHDFLRDNWSGLELAREWMIFSEPGDEEAGYEYPTEVGRIDLLAKHRSAPRWLVIELKRQSSADQTLAQLLRYMGWVKRHLANANEHVEGMIICRDTDKRLPYALDMVPNVVVKSYKVEFQLVDLPQK